MDGIVDDREVVKLGLKRFLTWLVSAGSGVLLLATASGEPWSRVLDAPLLLEDGLRIDVDEDGLPNFEIDELVHEKNGVEVRSLRLVGLTSIVYPDGVGSAPLLLHSLYNGLFRCGERSPGQAGRILMPDPNSFVYAEVVRMVPQSDGDEMAVGDFDDEGREFAGVSMETLGGRRNGWVEISLVGGLPMLTAYGFETGIGKTAVVNGVPVGDPGLTVHVMDGGPEVRWELVPGKVYFLEESADLISWEKYAGEVARDAATGMAKVSPMLSDSGRFYRLVACAVSGGGG